MTQAANRLPVTREVLDDGTIVTSIVYYRDDFDFDGWLSGVNSRIDFNIAWQNDPPTTFIYSPTIQCDARLATPDEIAMIAAQKTAAEAARQCPTCGCDPLDHDE